MDRDEMLRVLRAFDRRDSSTWEGAVRPLDRSDAEALRREFDLEDEQVAVQRFRTVEEMEAAPIVAPRGEAFERFVRHCARYQAIAPRSYPRGVFRFRSLAEAQAARDRVTRENVARLRARGRRDGAASTEEPQGATSARPGSGGPRPLRAGRTRPSGRRRRPSRSRRRCAW